MYEWISPFFLKKKTDSDFLLLINAADEYSVSGQIFITEWNIRSLFITPHLIQKEEEQQEKEVLPVCGFINECVGCV